MKIFVISGYGYWGDVTPDDLYKGDRQVGGGETAMISVSRELAKLGHDVTVFYDVKEFGRYSGVHYMPTELYVPMITRYHCDVLVGWDASFAFRFCDHADKRVLAFQLNDSQVGVYDWTIDHYFHPSKWHQDRFKVLYPEISSEKCFSKMTNGIDFDRYIFPETPKREPHRIIYSSSPDRGLHHLLQMWPRIREQVPDAELHVFYEIDKWIATLMQLEQQGYPVNTLERGHIVQSFRASPPEGVTFHGGVGQGVLSREQLKSAVLAYPCDPVQPTEGFSMTILEGITAGCQVVTTDADALPELWGNAPGVTILPNPVDQDLWVKVLVDKLRTEQPTLSLNVKADYSWASIARRWEEVLCGTNKQSSYSSMQALQVSLPSSR